VSVLAIIAALLLEQWRPLAARRSVAAALGGVAASLEHSCNGGERGHGAVAWLVIVLPAVAATILLYALLYAASPLLALLLNVASLYLTLGFRQFSHHFTQSELAVKAGEIERARGELEALRGLSGVVRGREGVIRLTN